MSQPAKKTVPTGVRLLALATDHVRRYGQERTTLVALAREAGISHAAIYRYYASREGLIDAVTGTWLKDIETQLAGVADSPDPADDKLERMMLLLARLYRSCANNDANLFAALLTAIRHDRPVARRHRRRLRTLLERVVEEGRASEQFQARSNMLLVTFLTDSVHRFIDPQAIEADRGMDWQEIDQRLGRIARVVIRAMMTSGM